MVGKLLKTSAVAIFIAISLRSRSVTIIIPYLAKDSLSGEGLSPHPVEGKSYTFDVDL